MAAAEVQEMDARMDARAQMNARAQKMAAAEMQAQVMVAVKQEIAAAEMQAQVAVQAQMAAAKAEVVAAERREAATAEELAQVRMLFMQTNAETAAKNRTAEENCANLEQQLAVMHEKLRVFQLTPEQDRPVMWEQGSVGWQEHEERRRWWPEEGRLQPRHHRSMGRSYEWG